MEMRKVYAETVKELALADESIFVLEADLSSAISTSGLAEVLGKRYVNLGIMEANMMGVAAGVSVAGGVCFVHTFGQFATRRAFDQIFVSLAYAKQHVVIVGSDSGVTAEHNGGTHMTFEDSGLMRLVPNAFIYDVADAVQLRYLLKKAYREKGVHYLRIVRKEAPAIYKEGETFESGSMVLRSGKDVSLLANGIEVAEALKAANLLASEGIDAEVIDCYQLKPIDSETIVASARKTKAVVTCENHNAMNGLGSAVAEVLSEQCPTMMRRVGVHEQFGQVGRADYLKEVYHLTAETIIEKAKEIISR